MKTILGKTIINKSLYKASYDNNRIGGSITLSNGAVIIIFRGKFLIYFNKVKTGVILKKSPSYRKIKRIIAIWFKTYRNNNPKITDR